MRFTATVVLVLLLLVSGCSKERTVETMTVSFDGTLAPSSGAAPKVAFDPLFLGYLMRQSLHLSAGEQVTYDLRHMKLEQGTLLIWFKQDFVPPLARTQVLSLAGSNGSQIDICEELKGMSLATKEGAGDPEKVSQTAGSFLAGQWQMLSLTWSDSAARLYSGTQLLASSSVSGFSPESLAIGVWGEPQKKNGAAITVRDLTVRNQTMDDAWIRAQIEAHPIGTSKLVYRQADFTHWDGKTIPDPQAKGGAAWTPDTLLAKAEKITLPSSGEYELAFRVKASTNIDAGGLKCEIRSGSSTLVSRTNSADELQKGARYQEFITRFHGEKGSAIDYRLDCFFPGKYSLLLDTATVRARDRSWEDSRRVEDLEHTMGVWRGDPEAAHGRAWSNQNALNIGPYTCIGQPGRYRATWRIKLSSHIPANTPVVLLKVFSHDGAIGKTRRGNKDYASLTLNSDDFPQRDTWLDTPLEFDNDGSDMVEFIAHAKVLEPGSFLIDTITVEPWK